jgi:hypothetical protein
MCEAVSLTWPSHSTSQVQSSYRKVLRFLIRLFYTPSFHFFLSFLNSFPCSFLISLWFCKPKQAHRKQNTATSYTTPSSGVSCPRHKPFLSFLHLPSHRTAVRLAQVFHLICKIFHKNVLRLMLMENRKYFTKIP